MGNYHARAVEVLPLVLIVATVDDFSGKSQQRLCGKSISASVTWQCLCAQLNH